MLTIHALRTGQYIMLSEQEFLLLIQALREIQSVEVIEKHAENIETEEERPAYVEALEELEQGETIDFEEVKHSWLRGEPADVHLAT